MDRTLSKIFCSLAHQLKMLHTMFPCFELKAACERTAVFSQHTVVKNPMFRNSDKYLTFIYHISFQRIPKHINNYIHIKGITLLTLH